MEAQLEVTFVTAFGCKVTKVFTRRPLGMRFLSRMPIVIKGIQNGSPADQLGVKVGWQLHAIAGKPMTGKDIALFYRALVVSSAPLRSCMVVRPTPLKTASTELLAIQLKSHGDDDVVTLLSKFGFAPQDAQSWGGNTSPPELRFTTDGHREMGKPGHTWYAIVGKIIEGQSSARSWMVERRLVHVRSMLYEPLRREWGDKKYSRYFKNRPFPRRGAPPGTTARLQSWLNAMSEAISFGATSPAFIASIFRFLEAPTLCEDAGQSMSDNAAIQLELPCTIHSEDDRTHQVTHEGTSGVLDASIHDTLTNESNHDTERGVAERVDAQAHNVSNDGLAQLMDDGHESSHGSYSQDEVDAESDAGREDSGESSDESCLQDVLDDGTEQGSDDGTEQGSDDGVETGDFLSRFESKGRFPVQTCL